MILKAKVLLLWIYCYYCWTSIFDVVVDVDVDADVDEPLDYYLHNTKS